MIHSTSHDSFSARLRGCLQTDRFGRSIRFFEALESTNTEAMAWANEGVAEGALVIAEFQSAGRGRQGRHWNADVAKNLLFSLVLRPSLPASHWGLITIAASLAVAETIDGFISPIKASIKWPNDVLVEGKKCCGMLMETVTSGPSGSANTPLVLGIGINVNQESFPQEIEDRATSILLECGRHIPRVELLAKLLFALERRYEAIQRERYEAFLHTYEANMAYLHQKSQLFFAGQPGSIEGTILGISPTGALRFETGEGERLFHAGEVTTSLNPA